MAQQMTRKEHAVPWVFGIPIGLSVVWGIKLLLAPVPIIDFKRDASPKIVHAGEVITVSWTETRTAECSSIIKRHLITSDGKLVMFEDVNSKAKPVGPGGDSFEFIVPPLASPGKLIYRARSTFVCNWVQALFGGPTFILPDLVFEYQLKPASAG